MTTYQTKRFDCWQQAKELRASYFADVSNAKREGKLIVSGSLVNMGSLSAGIPGTEQLGMEIYAGVIQPDPELRISCYEELERRGYSNDICAQWRLAAGSMLLGRGPFGEVIKPDLFLTFHGCGVEGKLTQAVCEHYGIPYFIIENPLFSLEKRADFHSHYLVTRQYLVSQMQEAIEWMEKVTGRRYDDEKLIESASNEWQTGVLWGKICVLNQAIPAPMDLKSMVTFHAPLFGQRHKKKTVGFLHMLYDEMQDRVQNQIAAVPTERCRLFHMGLVPMYFLRMFRQAEIYGVVFPGSDILFTLSSAVSVAEDGSWRVMPTLEEQGIELKTREDALGALADLGLLYNSTKLFDFPFRVKQEIKMVEDWHCDGAIIHFDRGCRLLPASMPEVRLELRNKGIPSAIYEANASDPRDFAEAQVMGHIEAFFESLGLTPLAS